MNEKEVRNQFASQMIKYLGGKENFKQFLDECRTVGFDIGKPSIIKEIAKKPEWFTIVISYHELGLLKRLSQAIKHIKE